MKEFADDNFKFDENGRMLFKREENTEEKGEIAHYEQFLLITSNFSFSRSVFKRPVLQTRENQGLFVKGLNGNVSSFILDSSFTSIHPEIREILF